MDFRRVDSPRRRLLVVGRSYELDEVAVGVFDHGEGNLASGDDGRTFGEDLDSGFLESLQGDFGAVHVNGEIAETKAAGDVGLVAFLALINGRLHEFDGGGAFAFTEGELFDDDFFARAEAGIAGQVFSGSEFSSGGESDGFGVEFHRFIEVTYDDAKIDGCGAELGFVGGDQ